MLLSFTFNNFRSFSKPTLFGMLPISCVKNESKTQNCLIDTGNKQYPTLLKSAAIYGANASGKSNLLQGIAQMQEFVLRCDNYSEYGEESVYVPFLFSQDSVEKPALFEIQFLIDGGVFRYGFEILQASVLEEWLYKNEMKVFHRENQNVQIGGFSECEKIQIEEDVLFLSTCHRFIDDVFRTVMNQFRDISVVDVWDEDLSDCEYLCDSDICAKLLPLIKLADNGIQNLKHTTKYTFPEIIYNIPKKNDQRIFIEEFSPGVKRVIGLAYQMLQAIEKNQIVIIDEIDIQLHPRLFGALLDFYHNHQSSQSQLIFTSHNTYPLWKKMLRRDQIWFVNKNNDLSSTLVNFTEFKIPPEASYGNDYLNGRYGGVPLVEM